MSQAQTPTPIYADRATGEKFPDARAMVNTYLKHFAQRAGTTLEPLDDSGYTQVRKGSAHVGVNVLEDAEIRQGIKEFANWPTIPQLYVKGEFVGGCDITREMFQSGELQALLTEAGVAIKQPAKA